MSEILGGKLLTKPIVAEKRALRQNLQWCSMHPTATTSVHRVRFVDYTPSPITSVALPPIPITADHASLPKYGYMAVGRANGNIELMRWSGMENETTRQTWVLYKVCAAFVQKGIFLMTDLRSSLDLFFRKLTRLYLQQNRAHHSRHNLTIHKNYQI